MAKVVAKCFDYRMYFVLALYNGPPSGCAIRRYRKLLILLSVAHFIRLRGERN